MKNILLFIFYFFCNIVHSQGWEWANVSGGPNFDCANSIACDSNGNVYLFGESGTSCNVFLTKYDSAGTVIWSKTIPGAGYDLGASVTIDISNNICITGAFMSSTLSFDSITLTNVGSGDIFIAKYNPAGDVIWAKSAGGNDGDAAVSIATDYEGYVYICGSFWSTSLNFGSITVNNLYSGINPIRDLFIAKYDPYGNVVWVKVAGGNYNNASFADALSVSTDYEGNIYMTGAFACTSIAFDSEVLYWQTKPTNIGDMFIVKFNKEGNTLWAKSAGEDKEVMGASVACDLAGNVYLGGTFYSASLSLAPYTLLNPYGALGPLFGSDYLIKYDTNGNIQWAKNTGTYYWNEGDAITTDKYGTVYMTGYLADSITSSLNTYLVRYDGSGNIIFQNAAEGGNNRGSAVATDGFGNVYLAGNFYDSVYLAPFALNSSGSSERYTAKLLGTPIGLITDIQQSKGTSVSLYPNPSSGIFILNLPSKNARVCVYDLLGKCISEKNYRNEVQPVLDLSKESRGMYYAEIISENERTVQKIVIQ